MPDTPIPFARAGRGLALAGLLVGSQLAGAAALRAETFIQSDDYREGEEVTGVFLTDEHYRIMVEDFERRGQDFDWGWALTPKWERQTAAVEGASDDAAEPPKKGALGRLRGGRGGGPKPESEPAELAFDIASYATVRVPEVQNFSGIMKPEELASVRDAFVLAAEQLGLEVVGAGEPADLELGLAVVDVNRQGARVGWIQVEPFIEVELRLRELAGERDLLLIRNQEHAATPADSALSMANQIVLFLR